MTTLVLFSLSIRNDHSNTFLGINISNGNIATIIDIVIIIVVVFGIVGARFDVAMIANQNECVKQRKKFGIKIRTYLELSSTMG